MSGPVWRFERELDGCCVICLRSVRGVFVEAEVIETLPAELRRVCPTCMRDHRDLIVAGETGTAREAPAYARR